MCMLGITINAESCRLCAGNLSLVIWLSYSDGCPEYMLGLQLAQHLQYTAMMIISKAGSVWLQAGKSSSH